MKQSVVFIAIAFVLTIAEGGFAAPVAFYGIGDLPGGSYESEVWGLSADGQVAVGDSGSIDTPDYEAARWTIRDGLVGLGDFPGGEYDSSAYAVSYNGSVIVGQGSTENSSTGWTAFRWTQQTGLVSLGNIPGGSKGSKATAVSWDGSIITGSGELCCGGSQAFRWTQETGMVGLGYLHNFFYSQTWGISADGEIIVGASKVTNADFEAFRWTEPTGMVGLGDLPGGIFDSRAFAVSADGTTIVGLSSSSASGDEYGEAFVWTEAEGMIGLGTLDGDYGSEALAVSGDGSVIAGWAHSSTTGLNAMIWDDQYGMREIQMLLVDLGLNLEGWHLSKATAISEDGLTIAGWGKNPEGFYEGWVAVIPEPSMFLLITSAVVFVQRGRQLHRRPRIAG